MKIRQLNAVIFESNISEYAVLAKQNEKLIERRIEELEKRLKDLDKLNESAEVSEDKVKTLLDIVKMRALRLCQLYAIYPFKPLKKVSLSIDDLANITNNLIDSGAEFLKTIDKLPDELTSSIKEELSKITKMVAPLMQRKAGINAVLSNLESAASRLDISNTKKFSNVPENQEDAEKSKEYPAFVDLNPWADDEFFESFTKIVDVLNKVADAAGGKHLLYGHLYNIMKSIEKFGKKYNVTVGPWLKTLNPRIG